MNPVYTVKHQISEAIVHQRTEELCKKLLDDSERAVEALKKEDLKTHERVKLRKSLLTNFEKRMLKMMIADPSGLTVRVTSKIPVLNRYKHKLNDKVKEEVVRMLKDMQIPDPERVADMYPHELRGGMAQRVVIAMGLSCNPKLLIADEPTTNLDVTVQLQILTLIRELKKDYGTTIQYITHDLGVVAEMCDRVAVMYAGNVVELSDVIEIFKNPLHPYTRALLECIPRPGQEFKSIEGFIPSLINPPSGCRFHPRCTNAIEVCKVQEPQLSDVGNGHLVACHLFTK